MTGPPPGPKVVLSRAGEKLAPDPAWYRDAIIYEVRVRSFFDSNDDGIGDFRGLTGKLDYLQDLGVNAIWVLPFYPSPLRDDGYDIADYTDVHPDVGTLADLEELVAAAHRRGIRIINELVLNHTSDQHPWFKRARRAPPGSVERDFYVWSDTSDRYREARIIFKDFEHSNWSWDPVVKAYYWHRFYAHQPDLNFGSPAVREALLGVVDFWFDKGIDGLRLDAVPYLYGAARPRRQPVRRQDAAGGGQPVAGGRVGLLRRRRRVPHELPLSADAADVHGHPHGGPLPAARHPGPDAAAPPELPVGAVPPQPRRADAGDGH
jgi:maltose alpha-D-glucosyltransferase/alpha-amylase